MWKFWLRQSNQSEVRKKLYDQLIVSTKISRRVYDMLIDDGDKTLTKYVNKWVNKYNIDRFDYELYFESFTNLLYCTKITKYRDFQYRSLLDKIITNENLFQWGKRINALCTFCKEQDENIFHLLWDCVKVKPLINYLKAIAKENNVEFCDNEIMFIFNSVNKCKNHIINLLCIFTKQYVYSCHCRGMQPSINHLKDLIGLEWHTEYFNAKHKNVNKVKACIKKMEPH